MGSGTTATVVDEIKQDPTGHAVAGGPWRLFYPKLLFDAFPDMASRVWRSCRCIATLHCRKHAALRQTCCLQSELLWYRKTSTWLQVTSMVQAGGANQDHISNLTVPLKKRQLCGALAEVPANGLTCVALSSRPSLRQSGSYGNTALFEIHREELSLTSKDQTSHVETWIRLNRISRSSASEWLSVASGPLWRSFFGCSPMRFLFSTDSRCFLGVVFVRRAFRFLFQIFAYFHSIWHFRATKEEGEDTNRAAPVFFFERSFGYLFNPSGKSQKLRRPDAESHQSVVEGKGVPWRQNVRTWWRKSTAFSALAVKVGRGVRPSWTRLKGDKHDVETIQIQEKSTGNLDWVLHKNGKSWAFGRIWNYLFALKLLPR